MIPLPWDPPRHLSAVILTFALTLCTRTATSRAEEPTNPLPPIIARTFELDVERRSNSNLTYLLRAPQGARLPDIGRILLVRKEEDPIIAVRVLKHYPEKEAFAAKRVRRYRDHRVLNPKEKYIAIEKKSDLEGAIPPKTPQDQADLKELESPVVSEPSTDPSFGGAPPPLDAAPAAVAEKPELLEPLPKTSEYDPELDSGSSPEMKEAEEDDEYEPGIAIEEMRELDPYRHTISAQFGFLSNVDPLGGRYLFTGGGGRYGFTPFKHMFLRKPNMQDSLSFETSVFIYKIVRFLSSVSATNAAIDTYTVLPTTLSLRYNIALSEAFSLFLYAGMMKNWVIGTTNGFEEALAYRNGNPFTSLNSLVPAVGGGFFLRIGPNWSLRIDAGFDFIGAGVVLKF